MFRLLSVTAFFAGAILLPGAVLAQAPEPVPTAGPDEIVFTGEVPAPPGTTVTVVYLLGDESAVTVCGTSITMASPSGDPGVSSFVVFVDPACVERSVISTALICWGGGFDDGLCAVDGLNGELPVPGDTIDTGLLRLRTPDGPTPPPGPIHGDRGPEIVLPPTGGGERLPEPSGAAWLLWAGAALLAAGLTVATITVAVRRERSP